MREPNVASVMTTRVITVRPETPFKDVVAAMTEHGISAVPVVDRRGRPIGVVSQADALAKEEFRGGQDEVPHHDRAARDRWYRALGQNAAELMTTPVLTVGANEPVSVAARGLARQRVRRLFVVDRDGHLIGVVSRRDLLRLFLRSDNDIRTEIERLIPPAVAVRVDAGVATVDGAVDSANQADTVCRLVLAHAGVATFLRDDEDVRADIEEHVFKRGMWAFPGTLTASVESGVAGLAGTVDRRTTAQVAGQLAQAIPGVVGVRNTIEYEIDDTVSTAL